MSQVAAQAAVDAAAQTPPGGEAFDVSALIMHHITNSHELEIPFTSYAIHLPRIHVGGFDLSITKHVVMMWVACAILFVLARLAARRVNDPVPTGWRNGFEVLIKYLRDEIVRKTIGHDADRYLSYLLTCFFFIWTCGLLGLVPSMSTPTSNIAVTATLAILAFIVIQVAGMLKFGVVGHLKNIVPGGLPLWLYPIMIPVEILGLFTKPFALCIRLFANMTAGHVVIIGLISLIFILKSAWVATVSVPFTLFIFLLELLVCFIQAFIFTTLVSTFIGMSVHPAH
jgi:F-type H+-transporting ATPase subunit a